MESFDHKPREILATAPSTLKQSQGVDEMNNYRLLYEDLLDMERRALRNGFPWFAAEILMFRRELLIRYHSPVGVRYIY
jgi:hypothetical protein